MTKKERAVGVVEFLNTRYAAYTSCYLNYKTDYEVLISAILSAQCTDARVNMITERLFKKYTCLQDYAGANLLELEQDIKQAGFYHEKAKHIRSCAAVLLQKHGGQMPREMEELTALDGVGRKTANVIRAFVFNIPCCIVDTHVLRLSNRFGLIETQSPVKAETELIKLIPEEYQILYNTRAIAHGRAICKAQKPKCSECELWVCAKREKEFASQTQNAPLKI